MFESLESRKLLAVSVSVDGGVLTVNGDNEDNVITVVEDSGNVHVETSTLPDGVITTQDFAGITQIQINGGDNKGNGDVIFYQGNTIGATIHGDSEGKGNHTNNGNQNGWVNGVGGSAGGTGDGGLNGAGDFITVIDAGSAGSIVDGDQNNDTMTIIVGNGTQVFGGDGSDSIFLNTGVGVYNTAAASTTCYAEKGNDTITVYDGTNFISGGAGQDVVIDAGGNNTIVQATVIEI